jgi:hypothetical protein
VDSIAKKAKHGTGPEFFEVVKIAGTTVDLHELRSEICLDRHLNAARAGDAAVHETNSREDPITPFSQTGLSSAV